MADRVGEGLEVEKVEVVTVTVEVVRVEGSEVVVEKVAVAEKVSDQNIQIHILVMAFSNGISSSLLQVEYGLARCKSI